MSSYTIATIQNLNLEELKASYEDAKQIDSTFDWTNLDYIFNIACHHVDRFPGINIKNHQSPDTYIHRWVQRYYEAETNLPSKRKTKPKSSCTDPAIREIVRATRGLSNDEAMNCENVHNLFMSAENIQGNLLEEYIALKTRKYGFLWCNGNVLRAIDFCNTDGSLFLQTKNKSNTENSSSSNIREGTNIKKWFRLGTRTQNGQKYPDYKWADLNAIINSNRTDNHELNPCQLSEEEYISFLDNVATRNTELITDK